MTQVHDATADAIAKELHELAAPIRQRLEKVDEEIAALQAQIETARLGRAQLRTALRAVDPTYTEKKGPQGKPGQKPVPSETALAAIREQLAVLNGAAFTASELIRRPDWPQSQSHTAAVLRELHRRGVLRLDHTGRGSSKFYVLV